MLLTVEKFLFAECGEYPTLSKSCPLKIKFSLKKPSHSSGFTLAEVLVTLGIIGIVAEMTIPTILSSTKDQVLSARFEREYSTFQQAMARWENDVGCTGQSGQCMRSEPLSDISKYLKISSSVPLGTMPGEKRPLWYDSYPLYGYGDMKRYFLPDGSEFVIGGTTVGSDFMYRYTFDINGYKTGPNTLGIDRFLFTPTDSSALLKNYIASGRGAYGTSFPVDDCANTTKALLSSPYTFPVNDNACEYKALQLGGGSQYYKYLRRSGVKF